MPYLTLNYNKIKKDETLFLIKEKHARFNSVSCSCSHSWVEIISYGVEETSFYCEKCSYNLTVKMRWIDEEGNKSVKKVENPYLDIFQEVKNLTDSFTIRGELTKYYSFAVPDPKALAIIKSYGPIVEMGAGTGYWARLLKNIGTNIIAYDRGESQYGFSKNYFPIKKGTPENLLKIKKRNLLLIWPCYATSFAFDSLKSFQGEYFIYIGESHGGCTGDDDFFELLEAEWELVRTHDIPVWYAIHDSLYVYQRKK